MKKIYKNPVTEIIVVQAGSFLCESQQGKFSIKEGDQDAY